MILEDLRNLIIVYVGRLGFEQVDTETILVTRGPNGSDWLVCSTIHLSFYGTSNYMM
jgi:hypothetical protein